MKMTKKIQKAINLASRLHLGQVRKGDGELPYISHPFSVAWILSAYTANEDVVVAGLLHDVLEDVVGYNYEDLARDFSTTVANIVKAVSEDKDPAITIDEKATWLERKRAYLDNLRNDSEEAMMVSGADKIHNLQSMIEAYKEQGESLWERFNSPADKKIWFYEEVLKLLKEKLNNPIVQALEKEIDILKGLISDAQEPIFVGFEMNDKTNEYFAYLVNNSKTNYKSIETLTGANCVVDEDLLETSKVAGEKRALNADSYILIEKGDIDDLEFSIWYHLDLYTESGLVEKYWFEIPRYNYDDKVVLLPVVNSRGLIVKVSKRSEKLIDEEVEKLNMGFNNSKLP